MYSMRGKPSEALAASATCKWRIRSSSSIPASNTKPIYVSNRDPSQFAEYKEIKEILKIIDSESISRICSIQINSDYKTYAWLV